MNNELYHYGILGQKWGVRRYQNEDGSLTPEGELRYGKKSPEKGLALRLRDREKIVTKANKDSVKMIEKMLASRVKAIKDDSSLSKEEKRALINKEKKDITALIPAVRKIAAVGEAQYTQRLVAEYGRVAVIEAKQINQVRKNYFQIDEISPRIRAITTNMIRDNIGKDLDDQLALASQPEVRIKV